MERPDISPDVNNLLQDSQFKTASAEKSCSMLRKLLAKNRTIKVKNVKPYMFLHFDSFT